MAARSRRRDSPREAEMSISGCSMVVAMAVTQPPWAFSSPLITIFSAGAAAGADILAGFAVFANVTHNARRKDPHAINRGVIRARWWTRMAAGRRLALAALQLTAALVWATPEVFDGRKYVQYVERPSAPKPHAPHKVPDRLRAMAPERNASLRRAAGSLRA